MSKGARAHTLAHGAWCIAMSLCLRARAILLVNAHRREGGKSCRGGCGLRKIDRIPQSRPKRRTGLMLRSRLVQQARREAERSSQHFRSAEERRECESSEHLRIHPVSIAARAPPVPPARGPRVRPGVAGWGVGHLLTFLHFFVSVHLVSASARHRAPALNPPPLLYVGPLRYLHERLRQPGPGCQHPTRSNPRRACQSQALCAAVFATCQDAQLTPPAPRPPAARRRGRRC